VLSGDDVRSRAVEDQSGGLAGAGRCAQRGRPRSSAPLRLAAAARGRDRCDGRERRPGRPGFRRRGSDRGTPLALRSQRCDPVAGFPGVSGILAPLLPLQRLFAPGLIVLLVWAIWRTVVRRDRAVGLALFL